VVHEERVIPNRRRRAALVAHEEHLRLTDAVVTGEETGQSSDLMGGELKAYLAR
jgi:hypothetical protein